MLFRQCARIVGRREARTEGRWGRGGETRGQLGQAFILEAVPDLPLRSCEVKRG